MTYHKLLYVNKCLSCKKRFRSVSVTTDLCQICNIRLENWISEQLKEIVN